MIIDVHAHYFPEAYSNHVETLGLGGPLYISRHQAGRPAPKFARRPEDTPTRLATMDAAGVERQILSIIAAPYFEDEAQAVGAAQLGNGLYSDFCRAAPGRFSFWASLPLPHVEASIVEARRALDHLGAVGVTIQCACLGESIAAERFDPLYAELDRRAAVIFLHPCQNALGSHLIGDFGLTVCAGASMEDSVAALHLVTRGHPHRYPNLRFIVPHFGGLLPMLLNRLDGQMPRSGLASPPSEQLRRFFYDTVGWGSKPALAAAAAAFGAQQLVPGSDWPILLGWESYAQTFEHIRQGGLADDDVRSILHGNAQRLMDGHIARARTILERTDT